MSTTEKPTRQDDFARLLRILHDAPPSGLSIAEIQVITAETGEKWSLWVVNDLLCGLGNTRVMHTKIRTRTGKVTKYALRPTEPQTR